MHLYDPFPLEEMFYQCARSRDTSPHSTCGRGRSRPRRSPRRRIANAVGATHHIIGGSTPRSATPPPLLSLGAVGAFDAHDRSPSGTGGDAPPNRRRGELSVPARSSRTICQRCWDATYAGPRVASPPSGEMILMGVPLRALFAQRRNSSCSAAARRHDQYAAVDPSHLIACGAQLEPVARHGVVHTRDQPDDARTVSPLPIAVVDLDDGGDAQVAATASSYHRVGVDLVAPLRPRTRYRSTATSPTGGDRKERHRELNRRSSAPTHQDGELFDQSYEEMRRAFNAAVARQGGLRRRPKPSLPSAARCGSGRHRGQHCRPPSVSPNPVHPDRERRPSGSMPSAGAMAGLVHDLVLVIGVEKMATSRPEEGLLSRAAAGHPIYTRGETAPVLFAVRHRHMHEFGTTQMLAGRGQEPSQRRPRPYAHFQDGSPSSKS